MKPRNTEFPPIAFFFKGAGGGGGQQQKPRRTATPAAPPTTTQVEVTQAARDTRKQAGRKRGFKSTILAGETGGFKQPGTGTILGNHGG